jgi:formate dehydrogenase major subunit
VPGLGTSYGRGGATTFSMDLRHSDVILIMGSNMAECHPVAFRWVIQAKTRTDRPCVVMHADPRFTRTSALADVYAPVRAGSDIVFLGALIKYVLDRHDDLFRPVENRTFTERERFFREYLLRYTNAPTLVNPDFKDTEDREMEGLFSGFTEVPYGNGRSARYDPKSWAYQSQAAPATNSAEPGKPQSFADQVSKLVKPSPPQDPELQNERCVFRLLQKHYQRYTPELVEQVCGTPRDVFLRVAANLYDNAGPDRSGAICYAVGWTQHTTGVQMIRAAAVLQLLLGNIGRPGGGILALRGHATIQGSTDIATLYNIHPGYLPTPSALSRHETIQDYIDVETSATSYWSKMPDFLVSQLKAWYGDAATKENGFAYDFLPKIVGDHSHMPIFVDMARGKEGNLRGFFAMGQNPAVGGQNASFQRQALAKLEWLVVRDLFETETASFWKDSPEVKAGTLKPEEIDTEVFFLPAAAVAESDGSFTNTQRLVQFHEKAADPPGDARSDLWFTFHLGQLLKERYLARKYPDTEQGKRDELRDAPMRALTWEYLDKEENARWHIEDEPSARLVLKEINGYVTQPKTSLKAARPLRNFAEIKDDGSTACGAWIYTGVFAPTEQEPLGHNFAANRSGDAWVALGWGFAWPANRRLMYNRCSADPDGNPWAKEARLAREFTAQHGGPPRRGYVYWDRDVVNPATGCKGMWVGLDVPDFVPDKPPWIKGIPGKPGLPGHDGASPFIMKGDGKGWLYVPTGLVDGPMPTHYEPLESPLANLVYPKRRTNPVALYWKDAPGNTLAPESNEYPHVLSTYRLTEHHLSGVMSRWLPWLSELMPELFCELSPEHAAELGVGSTDWVRVRTPRGSIKARALVTRRIRPFRLKEPVFEDGRPVLENGRPKLRDRTVHHVGLPWHWGYKGLTTGDVVNDLSALVGDPNVSIHEAKVFVCQVTKD